MILFVIYTLSGIVMIPRREEQAIKVQNQEGPKPSKRNVRDRFCENSQVWN